MRSTSFRGRESGLEDMKSAMRNMYAGLLLRPSRTPTIAGRDVALQAQGDVSSVTGHICRQFGHCKETFSEARPQIQAGRGRRGFQVVLSVQNYVPLDAEQMERSIIPNGRRPAEKEPCGARYT